MYTDNNWYSLHFMRSNKPAIEYMISIKEWLVNHPTEIIIIECTRHGHECSSEYEQYPNVSVSEKRHFWNNITNLFENMIIDTNETQIDKTPISTLIDKNKRVLFLMADYANFTGNDTKALDSCKSTHSNGNGGIWPYSNKIDILIDFLKNSKQENKKWSDINKFYTIYINYLNPSDDVLIYSLELKYLNKKLTKEIPKKCSELFHIPDMDNWCPKHLLDGSQQANFYQQIVLRF